MVSKLPSMVSLGVVTALILFQSIDKRIAHRFNCLKIVFYLVPNAV